VSADEGGKIALDEALAAHGAGTSEKVAASLILGALDKICKFHENQAVRFLTITFAQIKLFDDGLFEIDINELASNQDNEIEGDFELIVFINSFALLIYQALDFGLKESQERELSPQLTSLINFMDQESITGDHKAFLNTIIEFCGEILLESVGGNDNEEGKKIDKHELTTIGREEIKNYVKSACEILKMTKIIQMKNQTLLRSHAPPEDDRDPMHDKINIDDAAKFEKEMQRNLEKNKKLLDADQQTTESAQKVKDAKPDANPSATQPEKSKIDVEKLMSGILAVEDSKKESEINALEEERKKATALSEKDKTLITKMMEQHNKSDDSSNSQPDDELETTIESKNQNSTKKRQNSTIEMRLIELTKIQINIKLAFLEEQRMSKSYENIFKDGRVCTHCFKNLIKPKNKCIVCCFGMCSAHQITVYLPSSFSLSDNLVHEVQESLGSIPKEKHKQFVAAPICKGCLGLVVDIKNEYFGSS